MARHPNDMSSEKPSPDDVREKPRGQERGEKPKGGLTWAEKNRLRYDPTRPVTQEQIDAWRNSEQGRKK